MKRHVSIPALSASILPLIFALSYFEINYHWEKVNRFGGILDIDEAGYTGFAINFTRQLLGGGVENWLHAFTVPNIHAPLAYAFASITMYFTGMSSDGGIIASAIFASATILFTFMLTNRLSSNFAATVATLLVISNPYFTNFARNFEFSSAAAFSFISFVYFFELSDGFAKIWPSILCGVCAGFLLLSRTVNISFAPAIVLSSTILLVTVNNGLWTTRIKNLILSIFAVIFVAGPWYFIHFNDVINYLLAYGYGSHTSEYSAANLNHFWVVFSHAETLLFHMNVMHVALTAFSLILFCVLIIVKRHNILKDKYVLFSIYLVSLYLLCFATLLTSDNIGSGFDVPLIPLLVVGTTVGIARLIESRMSKAILAAITVVFCCAALVPQVDDKFCRTLASDFSPNWFDDKGIRLVSCGGTIFDYLKYGGKFDKAGSLFSNGESLNLDVEKKWVAVNSSVSAKIYELHGGTHLVSFANRHMIVNVNTIELQSMIDKGAFFPSTQIDTMQVPDTVEGYKQWLSQEPNKSACLFIASTKADGQFTPAPTYDYLHIAFEQSGLKKVAALPLPDVGQEMVFWKRPDPSCQ